MTTYTVSPTGVSTPDLTPKTWSPDSSPLSVPEVPQRTPEVSLSSRPTRVKAVGAQQSPYLLPGGDLRGRRRRGTGGSESSKANGLTMENKASEDFFGSSSGYSSEDDLAGRCCFVTP